MPPDMSLDAQLAAYFKESASWDADRVRLAERSARRAQWLAALLGILATAACTAVAILTPLKRTEPFLIRVNDTTGVIDVMPAFQGGVPLTETVTRYLLMHYITTCERYTEATAEEDYSECGAFHSPQRNQAWAARWTRSNPDSPLNRYSDGSSLHVTVQAISFFQRGSGLTDLAQVRYATTRRDPGGADLKTTHWIATLQYSYVAPPTDPATRRWNPLGFRILDFRAEPELPPDAPHAAPASATVATAAPTTATTP